MDIYRSMSFCYNSSLSIFCKSFFSKTSKARARDKARETISSLRRRKLMTKLQTVIKRHSSIRFPQMITFHKPCEKIHALVTTMPIFKIQICKKGNGRGSKLELKFPMKIFQSNIQFFVLYHTFS